MAVLGAGAGVEGDRTAGRHPVGVQPVVGVAEVGWVEPEVVGDAGRACGVGPVVRGEPAPAGVLHGGVGRRPRCGGRPVDGAGRLRQLAADRALVALEAKVADGDDVGGSAAGDDGRIGRGGHDASK